ncbi:hypothetical protein [Streptomyces sp. NPDC002952]|uniref:hypothetical protein n=1 Tax=Streptomyces sp. NPDC002952 TaxID=3364673 RepID=UPI00369EDC15
MKIGNKARLAAMTAAALASVALPAHAADHHETYQIPDPVPGGFASWGELMTVQNMLDARADAITAAAKADPAGDHLGNITVSAPAHRIDVYWKGTMPSTVTALLTGLPVGNTVQVHDAPYTRTELQQATDRFTTQTPAADGTRIVSITPSEHADGLTIGITGNTTTARRMETILGSTITTTITTDKAAAPITIDWNRDHDISSYFGGGWWYIHENGFGEKACTTAFAVTHTNPIDHITRNEMLTAEHCKMEGSSGEYVTDMRNGQDGVNTAFRDGASVVHDWARYEPSNSHTNFSNAIFRGPVGSKTASPTKGSYGTYQGNYICTGGAMTGEHCMLKVNAVNAVNVTKWFDENKVWRGDLADASPENNTSAVAAGKGDSGGPAFGPLSGSNADGVIAKGILSYGSYQVTCGYTKYDNGTWPEQTTCYNHVGFIPITTVLEETGDTLITG